MQLSNIYLKYKNIQIINVTRVTWGGHNCVATEEKSKPSSVQKLVGQGSTRAMAVFVCRDH